MGGGGLRGLSGDGAGQGGDGGEFPLEKAMEALRGCAGCDRAKFGVICRFYYFLLRSHGL